MTWKTFTRKLYWKTLRPVSRILYHLPVKKNRIVFDNFGGKGFGGNPKFIAEALHGKYKSLEMIWLADNYDLDSLSFPEYIKAVPIDSVIALYYRATAKAWVSNVRHMHPMKKKRCQIYLQTWHGSYGIKKIEKDAEDLLSPEYIREARLDGEIADAIIADNYMGVQDYKRAFWLNSNVEILQVGAPQYDKFLRDKDDLNRIAELKKGFHFDATCYYVLYAPTFRDDFSTAGYNINYDEIIHAFEQRLHRTIKIIVRLHPNVSFQKDQIQFTDTVLDGTDYPDVQDLALATDAVISDYSSVLFDFALLEKPAFILALDYEDYEKKRGFIPQFSEYPFPIARSNEELADIIQEFDEQKYLSDLRGFYQHYPTYGNGHAAETIADWIMEKMNVVA